MPAQFAWFQGLPEILKILRGMDNDPLDSQVARLFRVRKRRARGEIAIGNRMLDDFPHHGQSLKCRPKLWRTKRVCRIRDVARNVARVGRGGRLHENPYVRG